jgi:hypothetical protein
MLAIGKDTGDTSRRVKGKIKACRVEYETKDRTNWKAVILAYSMEEAIAYIRKNVQGFDRYISTGIIAEIDAVDDIVFNDLFVGNTSVVETTISREDTDKATKPSADGDEKVVLCPWCQKSFINNITLGSHIKRFHMSSK